MYDLTLNSTSLLYITLMGSLYVWENIKDSREHTLNWDIYLLSTYKQNTFCPNSSSHRRVLRPFSKNAKNTENIPKMENVKKRKLKPLQRNWWKCSTIFPFDMNRKTSFLSLFLPSFHPLHIPIPHQCRIEKQPGEKVVRQITSSQTRPFNISKIP